MGSAFHQLCPRYSGTLTPTAPTAIRLWDTFTLTVENNKNKKSVKFLGDMVNFCDFIQDFVFTTNHHLNQAPVSSKHISIISVVRAQYRRHWMYSELLLLTSKVMSGRLVILTTLFLGRHRHPKRLTSTSCTYFRQ